MTSDARPWFPLFVDDFVGDEAVKLMDNRARGAFLMLLCHQWRHKSVPNDLAQLARICHEQLEEMRAIWVQIGNMFRAARGPKKNRLQNRKLEIVRRQQDTGSRKLRGPWQSTGNSVAIGGQKSGLKPDIDNTTYAGSWVRELGSMWEAQYHGKPAYPILGKHLKPLVDAHGLDAVRRAWGAYLKGNEARYASPARFAQTYGSWGATNGGLRDAYLKPGDIE